jgi:predicted RNA binding protein YcfA (HicA-like mRNA interferase family)
MNGKEVISRLKLAGWSLDRVKGSHHILTKDGIAVPVHGTRDLGPGLISAI